MGSKTKSKKDNSTQNVRGSAAFFSVFYVILILYLWFMHCWFDKSSQQSATGNYEGVFLLFHHENKRRDSFVIQRIVNCSASLC